MQNPDHPRSPEASHTTQTRMGPRPVPTGEPVPTGRRRLPGQPSTAARVIVWGGLAAGTAGLTAGGILAARKLADLISDDTPRRRPDAGPSGRLAPRYAELDESEREEIRRRNRVRAREDARAAADIRAEAARRRPAPSRNVARDLTQTAQGLSAGISGVVQSLTEAFESFRRVAVQANGVVSEFVAAADQLRSVLDKGGHRAARPRNATARPETARPDTANPRPDAADLQRRDDVGHH